MNQHRKTAEMQNALHKKKKLPMHAQGMSNSLQEHRFAMFFSCVPTVRQTLILFTCLCIAL